MCRQGVHRQPKRGVRPHPPELGESSAALHELVQQALTLEAHTRRVHGVTMKDGDVRFDDI